MGFKKKVTGTFYSFLSVPRTYLFSSVSIHCKFYAEQASILKIYAKVTFSHKVDVSRSYFITYKP
jgi:hypothetical protein